MQNLTLVGLQNAGEYFDQRRFSGAVVAHESDHLARLYVESDALQRMDARVPFVNVPHGDQRRVISTRHFNPPRRSAQPCIGDHGEDRQGADGELEPVGVDLRHHESIVDDADQ